MEFRELSRETIQDEHVGVIGKLFRFLRNNFFKLTTVVFAAIAISATFFAYRFYTRLHESVPAVQQDSVVSTNTPVSDDQLAAIRSEFEKAAEVPAGEEPSVGQIVDANQLRQQNPTFYADALNGDAIFIYTKKAYIYRPSTHKVVNVAPVNRDSTSTK